MAALPTLDDVLNHPAIWRGNACSRGTRHGLATGFPELDVAFPGAGWPIGALTEIYADRTGIGELQLVMPAAARLARSGQWVTFVDAPHVPYAPALAKHGITLTRTLMVNPGTLDGRLWAAEQALQASCSGAVFLWLGSVHERFLRRLQRAAEEGDTSLFLFRPAHVAPAFSAALRLHVSRERSRTVVRVLKRRGGGLPAPIQLDLHPWIRFPVPSLAPARETAPPLQALS